MVQFTSALIAALAAVSVSAAPLEARSNAKKGVAYNDAKLASGFKGTAAWGYNWASTSGGLDPSIAFVPMVHGLDSAVTGITGSGPVLTYNEPDMTTGGGGCNASPQQAATAWKALLPKLGNARIGSPAVTSNNNAVGATGGVSGLKWMAAFLPLVGGGAGSKISFQALHWYGVNGQSGAAQAQLLQAYLKDASSQLNTMYGKSMPIWLTEFAALPVDNAQVQADFLNSMIPFLDGFAAVERYSPFMVAGNMMTTTSASGQAFIKAN